MNWKGQTVLVTGAQGFIGSWLTERLLDEGATVVARRRDVEPESRFATRWEPRHALSEGLALTYEWYRRRFG